MVALSKLFERPPPYPGPYRTLAAELDAVRARKKGMSMFSMTRGGILRDDAFTLELMREAFDRGLAVMFDPDPPYDLPEPVRGVHGYVLHPDQAWRVLAHRALWATAFVDGGWSRASEAQQGLLLGYTEKQRAEWMARDCWAAPAFGGGVIYTLLDRAQRQRIVELGRRSFGAAGAIAGMTFFAAPQRYVPARAAARRVPPGLTLARASLEPKAWSAVFGSPKYRARPRVEQVTLTAAQARKLIAGLRSNVQLLTRRGWT